MKVVINRCFGGFGLSKEAVKDLGCKSSWDYNSEDMRRTAPELIALIEKKGSEYCSGDYAELKVVEIPDDVDWYINDYDGVETIEEVHRSWG